MSRWAALVVLVGTGCLEGAQVGDEASPDGGVCVGVTPVGERAPGPLAGEDGVAPGEPVVGEAPPVFHLTDVQPQSCGFERTYGLEEFRGSVTVLALLSGW